MNRLANFNRVEAMKPLDNLDIYRSAPSIKRFIKYPTDTTQGFYQNKRTRFHTAWTRSRHPAQIDSSHTRA